MKKLSDNKDASLFLPNFTAKDIRDIDFAELSKLGITHAAVDIDGTLVEVGSLSSAVSIYVDHLVDAKKKGYLKKIIVATNRLPFISKSARQWFELDGLVSGSLLVRKPSAKYYQKLLNELKVKPAKAVMIGDRLLQDVYGANRAGIWTILVDDLGREPWYDRVRLHRFRQAKKLKSLIEKLPPKNGK